MQPQWSPTAEKASPEPNDPYGVTKAATESAIRMWATEKSGRRALILRFAVAVLSEISDDWETERAYLTMGAR